MPYVSCPTAVINTRVDVVTSTTNSPAPPRAYPPIAGPVGRVTWITVPAERTT
ncbi:hypothetical protein SAMN05443247_07104 [Bradyrhizobium erythrophlei]|jgi:hypothetical protein|nr:hypothetical protein SAMN05443247_07104 [Bradyrhizobium erythrophlei]